MIKGLLLGLLLCVVAILGTAAIIYSGGYFVLVIFALVVALLGYIGHEEGW